MADKEPTGEETPKTDGQVPEQFSKEYVQELRQEAAKYRTQRNAEREKVEAQGDYAELKENAGKWAELEDKQKTDLEKLQEKLTASETATEAAQKRVTDTLIRAAFIEEASKAGFANPSDAYSLADRSGVSVKEDGEIEGVDKAVKALEGRLPLAQKSAPKTDGGVGGASGNKTMFTEVEIREQATMLNVDPVLLGQTYGLKLEK